MKIYKAQQITREYLDETRCDLCGEAIKDPKGYDMDDITIERREGVSYPDGGTGTTEEVDMCGNCWKNKFKPWLRSLGYAIRSTEWDY
jgi:hypothetical protein